MTQSTFVDTTSDELALIARTFAPQLLDGYLYDLLGHLNRQVEHRFTGVYRFDPGWVVSVALFDREAPDVRVGADVKMKESYCWLTGLGDRYIIEDAVADDRLAGHAAQEAVRSYLAVLLRDARGVPWGTLCHFDFAPHSARQDAVDGIERLRPLIEEMFVRDTPAKWDPDAPSHARAARLETSGASCIS